MGIEYFAERLLLFIGAIVVGCVLFYCFLLK